MNTNNNKTIRRGLKNRPRRNKKKNVVTKINRAWLRECYGNVNKRAGFQRTFQRTTLKYVQTVNFSVTAGTYAENQFRANSVFDPDLTGTGGQPLGFDNMAALFNRYRVNAFSFEVQMISLSASYKGVCVVVNGAETPTTYDEVCEYPRAQQRGIGFNGSPTAVFRGRVSLASINGKSQDGYHIDDATASQVNTNPAEAINFHVGIQNDNISTINLAVTCTMWYDVVFYDALIPVRSYKPREYADVVVGPNEIAVSQIGLLKAAKNK